MKKIFFASGLLALMMGATSCDKYDIYPEEFDSVFAIRDAGTRELTVYATDATAEVPFVVMKGGYDPAQASTATLKVMNDAEFAEYQETSGNLLYAPVGSECYSFSPSETDNVYSVECSFADENDKYRVATLYVRPRVLKTWLEQNAASLGDKAPVIPVTLVSSTDTVSSYNNVTIVSLNLRTPALTVDVSDVQSRTIKKSTLTAGDNFYRAEANFSIPCENPWGFTLNVRANDQAIADYNAANGTSYLPLDASAYTLQTAYHFVQGSTYMPLNLNIDLNKLDLLRTYAVAVSVDSNNPITWDDANNNPGDALEINGDMTMIFTVRIVDAVTLQPIVPKNVTANDVEPSEGALSCLFDGVIGGTSNYFHSGWTVANPREPIFASFVEIELPKPMSMFRFELANRESPTAAGYVKTVHLFATNDPNNWPTTPFAVITDMTEQLNGPAAVGSFGTDEEPYRADSDYTYLRFCVMESGGGSLGQPSTSVYWCASELKLYGY